MLRQLRIAARVGIVTEPMAAAELDDIDRVGRELAAAIRRRFGRSLAIRQVDAGSCNGCELEISGLTGPHYDLERFGLHFVASPRHADCLLVTGPVTVNMAEALRRTYDATPEPKFVVAVGDCGRDAGIFAGSYAVVGGVDSVVPVDAVVAGCPPSPRQILAALLAAIGRRP
jgi:Ni,Fe-hydrogenase III small subunit